MGMDRVSTKARLSEALAKTTMEKGIHIVKHPIDALRTMLSVTEAGTRIQEFSRALERAEAKYGKDTRAASIEAMLSSKDITINFTRMGVLSSILNGMVPFFNARVQGASKFYRAFIEAPLEKGIPGLEAHLKAFQWVTIPSLAIWWMNKDEEWYKELPKWRRLGFWNIANVGTDEKPVVLSIPKPFEVGYFFGSVPQAIAQNAYEKDPGLVSEAFYESFKTLLPAQHPMELLPAAVKPGVESVANYDSFKGRNIDLAYEVEAKLPKDRYSQYTTETAKILGKWLKVSPRKIEHMMAGHTGGLMLDTLRSTEALFGARGKATDKEVRDIPIVGTLFARSPYGRGRSVNEAYDLLEELRRKRGSKDITRKERAKLRTLENATRLMSILRKKVKLGQIKKEDADRRITELAKRALKR